MKLRTTLDSITSYGSGYNTFRTGIQFYSDVITYEKLEQLNPEDEKMILEAFHILYPVEDNSIDLCWIEIFIDPNKEIPIGKLEIENSMKDISFEYINEQISKIDLKIIEKDFDGAVTNSRTLLETILKNILENENIEYGATDDLISLYKKVSKKLNMNPSEYKEEYFKKILSGFFSIVQGISEIRNLHSDSHGKIKATYYKLKEHHAKLTIDSTKSICNYLYSTYMDQYNVQL